MECFTYLPISKNIVHSYLNWSFGTMVTVHWFIYVSLLLLQWSFLDLTIIKLLMDNGFLEMLLF